MWVVIVLFMFPTSGMANTVEFEFSGYINEISANENGALGNVYINQPFEGWFTYSSVADQRTHPAYGNYHQDASISVTLGTETINYFNDHIYIRVCNSDEDAFSFGVDNRQGDFGFTSYGVKLSDSQNVVFDSDDLPMSLDLNMFDSAIFKIAGYKYPDQDWFNVSGEITSLTPVPESATIMVFAFSGLFLRRRDK